MYWVNEVKKYIGLCKARCVSARSLKVEFRDHDRIPVRSCSAIARNRVTGYNVASDSSVLATELFPLCIPRALPYT